MNPTCKCASILVAFLFYLLGGAIVFHLLEFENEQIIHANARSYHDQFLTDHQCVQSQEFIEITRLSVEEWRDEVNWAQINETNPLLEKWNWNNALLFVTTVVTTIGYGHLAPRTLLSRSLVVPFAIIGIPLTALLLDTIGNILEERIRRLQNHLHAITSPIRSEVIRKRLCIVIICLIVFFLLVVGPSLIFMFVEGWSYIDGQYFTFVTISTIGFGDLVAGNSKHVADNSLKRAVYRYGIIVYIMVALSMMGILLKIVRQCEDEQVTKLTRRSQVLMEYIQDTQSSVLNQIIERTGPTDDVALEEVTSTGDDVTNVERDFQRKQVVFYESVVGKQALNTVNRETQTDITIE